MTWVVGATWAVLNILQTADILGFQHTIISSLKRETIEWATVLVGKMCCRRQKSKDNGVTALSRKEGNSNHLLQATFVEEHLWMDHISNLETDGLQQQTVDHTTYHSCQVNARIWWYNYTQARQNWSTEDQKNDPWADEVLLWHSDLVKTTSKYDSIQITADVMVQWYIPCMLVTH